MTIEILALENALLRTGFEAARVGICVVTDTQRIITVTSLFARALGLKEDDLLGGDSKAIHVALRLPADKTADVFNVEAPETTVEVTMASDMGLARYLLLESRPVEHRGQTFRLLSLIDFANFGVTRDKVIEFRRQQENLNTSIVVADALGVDLPLIYANPQFFNLTGYRASEVLGRNCRFLQGELTETSEVEKIREGLRMKRIVTVTLTNYRKDGSTFRNEVTISPMFDDNGGLRYFAATQHLIGTRTARPVTNG